MAELEKYAPPIDFINAVNAMRDNAAKEFNVFDKVDIWQFLNSELAKAVADDNMKRADKLLEIMSRLKRIEKYVHEKLVIK